MIKTIYKILLIISLVIIQVTLLPLISIKGVWPNIIFLTILVLILDDFFQDALFFAIVGGIFLDLASPSFFGLNIFVFVMFVLLIKFILNRFLTEPNLLIITFILGLSAILYNLIFLFIYHNNSFIFLLTSFFYNALAGLFIYLIFGYFLRKSQEKIEVQV